MIISQSQTFETMKLKEAIVIERKNFQKNPESKQDDEDDDDDEYVCVCMQ